MIGNKGGRPRLPDEEKVLRGSIARKSLLDEEAALKEAAHLDGENLDRGAADHLTPSQKEIWDYAIRVTPKTILQQADRDTLSSWAIAVDAHRNYSKDINENGHWVDIAEDIQEWTKPNGDIVKRTRGASRQPNPAIKLRNEQALIIIRLACELGFTPVSRQRIKLKGKVAKKNIFEFND